MGIQLCGQVHGMFWLRALGPLWLKLARHLPRRGSPVQSTPLELGNVRRQRGARRGRGGVERAKQPSHITPRADWLWRRFPESQVAPDTQLPPPLPPAVTP